MNLHTPPDALLGLFAELRAATSTSRLDVHSLISTTTTRTRCDRIVAAGIVDSRGFTDRLYGSVPAKELPSAALSTPTGDALRTAFGPRWPDVLRLVEDCATLSPARAIQIIRYGRSHTRQQRNAARAVNVPGLRTDPAANAVTAVIDALETNPRLAAKTGNLTNAQFAALCDELAGTGHALTVMHLCGRPGSGRLVKGHLSALTAAYRTALREHSLVGAH